MGSAGRCRRPAASMAAVPAIMEAMTAFAVKRPGSQRAKLSGSSRAAARRPSDRNPRSLMNDPWKK